MARKIKRTIGSWIVSSKKERISLNSGLPMYYFYPSAYMRIIEANKRIAFAMIKIEGELYGRNAFTLLLRWSSLNLERPLNTEHGESHLNSSTETKAKKQRENIKREVTYGFHFVHFWGIPCDGDMPPAASVLMGCHR